MEIYKVYASEDYVDGRAPDAKGVAHQQLVTDADGNSVWEDRLAWKDVTTQKGYVYVYQDAEMVSNGGLLLPTAPISSPVAGESYTIIIGGNEYTSKCVDASALTDGIESYVFGNTAAMGDDLPIENPDPDAEYIVLIMPGGSDGYYGMVLLNGEPPSLALTIRSTEEVETEVINIKRVDKELLDVDTPNWNASVDEAGYIEHRTHYSANVGTLVFDATNTAGMEAFTLSGTVYYRLSEHIFTAANLQEFTYYTADSSTGEKTAETITSTEDLMKLYGVLTVTTANLGISVVNDKTLLENTYASAGLSVTIPSNGTYISTTKAYAEIEVGEYVKQIDGKYVNLSNYYTKSETSNKISAAVRVTAYAPTGIGNQGVRYTSYPTAELNKQITAGTSNPSGNDSMIFNIIVPDTATTADTLNITVKDIDEEVVAVFTIDDAIVPGEERYMQIRCSVDKTNFPIVVATGASPSGTSAAALYSSLAQTHKTNIKFLSITIETGSGDANIPIGTNVKMWL